MTQSDKRCNAFYSVGLGMAFYYAFQIISEFISWFSFTYLSVFSAHAADI
jgi:hypothetical protein